MLPFFTDPYPDELLYSAIARYHFYSGNIDCKDTLEEVFQSRSVVPSVGIGSHFSVLAEQLGTHYPIETLLSRHTVYLYYASFLSKQRQQNILKDVLGDGQGLYTRLGFVAGSICKKDGIYYCAECAKADASKYGEPYIHREHQLQGIDYCPHHASSLQKYEMAVTSRIEYVRFELKNMNLSAIYEADPYQELLVQLAQQAYKLLQIPLHTLSREDLVLKYRRVLRNRNLITVSNCVRQKELLDLFKHTFPPGFLKKYQSEPEVEDEYNWLKIATRNLKRHVHPFRHLLMMHFLEIDAGELLNQPADTGPFEEGPWPCLNRAAAHYKELVIKEVEITRDFKTTNPIGTFSCSCGFVYSRKGPDASMTDQFRIGRIKAFGDVWQSKLEQLSTTRSSVRAIARELGVDSKTVNKYLKGVSQVKTPMKSANQSLLASYKKELQEGIKQFPALSRTELRAHFKKQYIFIYRHDHEWLMENLPVKQKSKPVLRTANWAERDQEYAGKIKVLQKELSIADKPVRMTKSLLGKKLGILKKLEYHLDKLPDTAQLLDEIIETVQQFQIRRCYRLIDQMMEQDQPIRTWEVQRIAAIRSSHFKEIQPQLEAYVQNKLEVKNDE
ncbi:TnsD family Tn7-like transposition protein [Bacillus badius]|uniref:Tn7-like transposition protein D n=1 Tax=Bacillus badius TaxID=1455 RepID=A0ABR5APL0_BACBA|nr:TnsD family Tn7-like transposition protein [Bacillus badius]KIL74125.1 Tn7-like transposition protein D [Bacillus badius]MED4717336.1 TnsD family transposase [Bacillus badius]